MAYSNYNGYVYRNDVYQTDMYNLEIEGNAYHVVLGKNLVRLGCYKVSPCLLIKGSPISWLEFGTGIDKDVLNESEIVLGGKTWKYTFQKPEHWFLRLSLTEPDGATWKAIVGSSLWLPERKLDVYDPAWLNYVTRFDS